MSTVDPLETAVARPSSPGLRRAPVLTLVVLLVTAVVSVVGDLQPAVLHALERTPAGLHGQWWRTLTSLVVQDGGVLGTATNLLFLGAVGVVAEQVVSRWRWLAAYLVTGVAGELFGYAWQPVGGGNSVAVCGLVGVVAVAAVRRDRRLPEWAAVPGLLWVGCLLAGHSSVTIVVAALVATLCVRVPRLAPYAGWVQVVAIAAAGVALSLSRDLHGGALLVGLALAAAAALVAARRPVR